jgi:hypothetical protein
MNIGDKVLAQFPSGWKLSGTIIMVIQPVGKGFEYDIEFFDHCHQSFLAEFVTLIS